MDQELPVKCSDVPQSTEGHFSVPWGQKESNEKFIEELQNLPYGSEKPVTLCEAFVRKYLLLKKSSVCMQMRRAVGDAREIYKL